MREARRAGDAIVIGRAEAQHSRLRRLRAGGPDHLVGSSQLGGALDRGVATHRHAEPGELLGDRLGALAGDAEIGDLGAGAGRLAGPYVAVAIVIATGALDIGGLLLTLGRYYT